MYLCRIFLLMTIGIGLSFASAGQVRAEDDFMFTSSSAKLCLDGHGRGKDVKASSCRTPFGAQRWSIDKNAGQIMHIKSNLCLAVSNSNRANGARVVLWPCNRGTNQRWSFGSVGASARQIKSALHGKCIDVSKVNHSGKRANIHLWDCHRGKNQHWTMREVKRTYKKKIKSERKFRILDR